MIEFETRSDRQKEMIAAADKMLKDWEVKRKDKSTPKESSDEPANPMAIFMNSDLANYADLIMADSNALFPIRVDALRQLVMYRNEDPAAGRGIAHAIAKNQPVKLALTAMGLAAISSGKDGKELAMTKYLPEIMKGRLFCYCITEPGAGTNTNKISTTAEDMGDHFILNGQKIYISAADTSHYMVTIAKLLKDGKVTGVGTFIFETETEGVSMTELDIAVLGDKQFTIFFDNVKIPKEAQVGSKSATKGTGISDSVFQTLNLERIIVGFTTISMCREALAKAIKKAKETPTFGGAPGLSPGIKQEIARVKIKLELANLATKKATESFDANEQPKRTGLFANMAKLLSTEAANEACDLALKLYGVAGMDKEADNIGSLYQMARLLKVVPINNEMVTNFLGEHMLGLPKSYR